jgi:hypothetical protein
MVISSEKIMSKENPNENKPNNDGDIIVKVFGLKNFYVWVRNTRDEPIKAYVNYTMEFGELGANSTIKPFPVNANSFTFIFWDCQPMPIYFIKITVEAGGETFITNGITILGLNFFFN